jgi:death on curing protein
VVRYLSTDDVIELAEVTVRLQGDQPQGLRDRGLLESAVMRAQFLAHYADADLVEQAAALANGISRSQAFVDGNKRAAYVAALVFLHRNGYVLVGDRLAFAVALTAQADAAISPEEADRNLADWLRAHTRPRS